jgi:hypothetical protein
MASMSYCAFENTANELRQLRAMLQEAVDNNISMKEFITERSSQYERSAVNKVMQLAADILDLGELLEMKN